jgi:sphingolipid delta-4 desaturase
MADASVLSSRSSKAQESEKSEQNGKGKDEALSAGGVFRDANVDFSKAQEDFVWFSSDEPHAARRKAMLAKYPQIRDLFGYEWRTKYWVILSVAIQVTTAYLMVRFNAPWWLLLLVAWIWGGTINHSLMLANHELSHDLLFATPFANRLFSFVPNLSLAVPMAATFKKYHLVHHLYQGLDDVDPDLPTGYEGKFFRHSITKLFFIFFQALIYSFRPMVFYPSKQTAWELMEAVAVVLADFAMLHFWGAKAPLYLALSSFLGSGLHPLAGHFVAEHYVWTPGFETFSYYGPINFLVYNVGYHNEHHDFPRIPGSRLPQLHKIAPEFYADGKIGKLPSWPGVILRFIFDPTITPFSRIKRRAVRYAPALNE